MVAIDSAVRPVPQGDLRRPPADWNGAELDVAPATLAQLFEAQARRTADLPAVIFPGGSLSYAQLDLRANQLARLLIRRGAAPERVVALALPRSTQIVVATLAVAKAGAAFLPVDPAYPAERIRFMLADAGPALVVTSAESTPASWWSTTRRCRCWWGGSPRARRPTWSARPRCGSRSRRT